MTSRIYTTAAMLGSAAIDEMITVKRAREILDTLDPSIKLPEGMCAGAFAEAYNNIIRLAFSE